jgi:hypothetical protein
MPGCRRGAADIAEQALNDCGGPDHLHAGRMMGPPDRVANGARAFAARIARQCFGNFDEHVARAAGSALHHVGRVGGVVAAQDLVDAMRMLQCRVAGRRPLFHPLGLFGKAFRRIDVMLASDVGTTSPWYCQLSYLYDRLSSSQPEKNPPSSLASLNLSSMIVERLEKASAYSLNHRLCSRM